MGSFLSAPDHLFKSLSAAPYNPWGDVRECPVAGLSGCVTGGPTLWAPRLLTRSRRPICRRSAEDAEYEE